MSGLVTLLQNDPEIQELRNKYHELTGEWLPYHWDCFHGIEDYKAYMRKTIKEHDNNFRN